MISDFVKISLKETIGNGHVSILSKSSKSITLSYPCAGDNNKCSPYVIEVESGVYRFECWGGQGQSWGISKPGKGGYAAGTIYIKERMMFFVYIGTVGFFNGIKGIEEVNRGIAPGGATDVRLNSSDKWWDNVSLASRIMVAGGGGGAEWDSSVGGNGGDIEGGSSYYYEHICKGGNQTSGSECEHLETHGEPAQGTFGSGGVSEPFIDDKGNDYGGYGGGGYYGGTSYRYAYPGSGGSSFISGHQGCNAVKSENDISPSGSPIHYSKIVFSDTVMIRGNSTDMPLAGQKGTGIHNGSGAFRITLLFYPQQTCAYRQRIHDYIINSNFDVIIILSIIS